MKIINLSKRLLTCANMVDRGSKIADIGTDHAYIPIHLALNGRISHAVACDISAGPLKAAQKNIERFSVQKFVSVRISDGFENISENEADEIIIAGMGGNVISSILEKCAWENKQNKKFILNPMKYERILRINLANMGYKIKHDRAVICSGKVYTVMQVSFTGFSYTLSPKEEYIGQLEHSIDDNSAAYIKKQITDINNKLTGAISQKNITDAEFYNNLIRSLELYIK